ncbi:BRCT domain-containing protein [Pontiellaceae bacterium B1224]|nr:BRCT domain-containing protein [Pontiellaceae bacterium B1224]
MNPDFEYTMNPELSFAGKSFCFTGKFDGYERVALERDVERRGATFTPNISNQTDYLIIGSKGLRCCSFSCCTRVVEKAIELKKCGASFQFIKEADYLDAVKD